MKFDESNGSQVEQVQSDLVDNEEPPSQSILRMGLGEVKPIEDQEEDQEHAQPPVVNPIIGPSSTQVEPSQDQAQVEVQAHDEVHDLGNDQGGAQDEESNEHSPQAQNEDDNDPIQRDSLIPHPRVHQGVQRDHPVDNIIASIRRGVTTHSRLVNFCAY